MRPEPFILERFFAEHEFSARHLLATSDCQGLSLSEVLALADADLKRSWDELTLGYTESQGLPALRAQIAAGYESVTPAEVLTAAPEEAVFLFMNALLEPGDRVICTYPGYQSLYELARTIGCEVVFWEPAEDGTWRFDPERLAGLLDPTTKLVVWNFPHNPTGALPSAADYARMLSLARDAGAWVLADEMYRLLETAPGTRLPAAVDRYERAVSLSGMSKAYGLAGLRLGWVATHDRELLERMMVIKDYTTICAPAPSELLALMALRDPEGILTRHRQRIADNIRVANGFFERRSEHLAWIPPQGGTVCFPKLLREPGASDGRSASRFCERLVREAGVLLLPSTAYGYGDGHFRMGLGRTDFAEGVAVLDSYLRHFD